MSAHGFVLSMLVGTLAGSLVALTTEIPWQWYGLAVVVTLVLLSLAAWAFIRDDAWTTPRWLRRTLLAFSSRQAFHHIAVDNGPLWWLCRDARALQFAEWREKR